RIGILPLIALPEIGVGTEIARRDELKEGPEIPGSVFNRRAREADSGFGPEFEERLRGVGGGVSQETGLVRDNQPVFPLQMESQISDQGSITCDNDIGIERSAAKLVPLRPM